VSRLARSSTGLDPAPVDVPGKAAAQVPAPNVLPTVTANAQPDQAVPRLTELLATVQPRARHRAATRRGWPPSERRPPVGRRRCGWPLAQVTLYFDPNTSGRLDGTCSLRVPSTLSMPADCGRLTLASLLRSFEMRREACPPNPPRVRRATSLS
jgi:hypothetical protein